jgi:hypothetical protein
VISLICSVFISVLLCGDLVPSHRAGEPKNRGAGERKQRKQGAGADGNGRDASPRVARRCASGGGITGENGFDEEAGGSGAG